MPLAPRFPSILLLAILVFPPGLPALAHSPHDDVIALAASPDVERDGFVLAAVRHSYFGAVLVSRDGGRSFTPSGRGLPTSLVEHFAVSPFFGQDGRAWALTRRGVLYETTDAARSWRRVEGWPGDPPPSVTALLAFRLPVDGDGASPALVIGLEDGGILIGRAMDGVWQRVAKGKPGRGAVTVLLSVPEAGGTESLLAGSEKGRLSRWSPVTREWTKLTGYARDEEITALAAAPDRSGKTVLFLARSHGASACPSCKGRSAGAHLSVSSDGGRRWTDTPIPPESTRIDSLAAVPGEEEEPILLAGTRSQGMQRFDAVSGAWREVSAAFDPPSPQSPGEHYRYLIAGESGRLVLAGTFEGLYRSEDGGRSWRQSAVLPPTIVSDVAFSPDFARDGTLWTSRYGSGLLRLRGNPPRWQWAAEALPDVFLYLVSAFRTGAGGTDLLALGARYLHRSGDGGETWSVFLGTQYASTVDASPDYAASGRLAVGDRIQGPQLSSDRGESWRGLSGAGAVGESDSSSSPGGGRTTRDHVSGLRFVPDDPKGQSLVLTTWRNGFFRSEDGGATWSTLPESPPAIRSLGISPEFSADGFALVSTHGGKILVTGDAGATWVPAGEGLPPGPVRTWLVFPDREGSRRVLAGTASDGVWLSDDGGRSFRPGRGPSTVITSLALSPEREGGRLVAAGTYHGLLLSADLGASFETLPDLHLILPMDQTLRYEGEWEINFHRAVLDLETRRALTREPGASVEAEVAGRALTIVGGRGPGFGVLVIVLDGEERARVDLRAEEASSGQTLFRTELPPGRHRLRLELAVAEGAGASPGRTPDAPAGTLSLERIEVERDPFPWALRN